MNIHRTRAPRPIAFMLCLLLSLIAGAQLTTVTEDYPDGKPKLYRTEADGKAEGLWLEWYPNGELRYRAYWKDGEGYGLWEYFYPTGVLRSQTVYEADLPVGIERAYHPNGTLATQTVYVAGKRHGVRRTYDLSGTELSSQLYLGDSMVVNEPRLFAPGVISVQESDEYNLTFTPTGNTLYFTRRTKDDRAQKIYRSDYEAGQWSTPTIAYFSTADDEGAHVSRGGKWLYFASARPLPGREATALFDMNLWRVDLLDGNEPPPLPLPATVNRTMTPSAPWPLGYEAGPYTDATGNLYYWTGLDSTQGADVVVSRLLEDGTFSSPNPVDNINTVGTESGPALSPDGKLLCFSAYNRSDTYGQEDLYCATREGDAWAAAVNLGPAINSEKNEAGASFSPDGKHLYFSRFDAAGEGADIYYVATEYLPLKVN